MEKDANKEWDIFFKEYIESVKDLYKDQFKPFSYCDDLNIDKDKILND